MSLLYYPLFIFRRLGLICLAIFCVDFSVLQSLSFLIVSLLWMAYIGASLPFWDWNSNCFEFLSECCVYIAAMHSLAFFLTDSDIEIQTVIGWSFMAFISAHVLISFMLIFLRI